MLEYKHTRVIDRHELITLVPYSMTHIGRLEANGQFPKRIKLGIRRVGWDLFEIQDWIKERKRWRDDHASPELTTDNPAQE